MEAAEGRTTRRSGGVALRGSAQLEEPEEEPAQKWDAQLQEFLETLQPPCTRDAQVPEARPGKDCRTPSAPSQGRTPGGLQASQAQPMPIGDAKQDLEAPCSEKKMRVRTWDTVRAEMWRLRFRELRYQDEEGPRETCRQLQELCCQWLRPKRHSKEQILDLLALEQFLAVLPPGMQGWVRESDPQSCTQAVALAEEFLQAQQGAEGWEPQMKDSSEDILVNLPETSKELPGAPKKLCFPEAKQGVNGSATIPAGNGWPIRTGEELKPSLEGPEEEEPQEMRLETAKGNNSPRGRKGDENPGRAESQNGNNNEMEAAEPVSSEGTERNLSEAAALQRVNSVKCEAEEESFGRNSHRLTYERSQAGGKTYTCWHCGRSFGSSLDLVSHERTHLGEKLYKCAHCGESERIHMGQKPHKCTHCGNTFGGNSQEGIHSVEKPYQCAVCGKNLKSHSGFRMHQTIHTGEKPYKCSHCGECFRLSLHLRHHKRKSCSPFGKSFSQNSDLIGHVRTRMAKETFTCFACGKVFDVRAELVVHIQTHKEKPFERSVRGMSNQDRLQQTDHQKVPTGEKEHKCSHCGKCFSRKQSLALHERIHAGGKPYKCLVCGKNFRYLQRFKSHKRTHQEEPYKCSYCDKRFLWSSQLVLHERIHTGEKPYRCSHCGKAFAWRSCLLVHVRRIHPGQKPDRCSDSGKSFSSDSGLLRDQKIHKGEEPCTCSECGRTFSQRSDQTERAGEKASKCSECSRSRDLSSNRVVRTRNSAEEKPSEHERSHAAKEAFAKKEQGRDAGALAGDGWPSETKEELKFSLESPEEEQVQEITLETAKENDSPRGRKGEEPCTCSKCGTTFWQWSDQVHRAGEEGSKCSECLRSRDLSSSRMVQARNCAEEKSFECSVCRKTFRNSSHLLSHQSVHGSVQPLCCSVCGRNIGRTPKGHKPYKCLDCEKS